MSQEINLVDLDYDSLKQNLVDYLKSTEVGKQFDLDSKNTTIDMLNGLFTYNTLIWLHYLHILNNESFISTAKNVESVSKLLQTTGFTPPTKKSALALVTVARNTGITTSVQVDRFATLRGRNNQNTPVNFYYMGPRTTIAVSDTFEFYAGSKLVKQLSSDVDLTNQEYKIPDKDVDVRTILVSVNGTYWTNYTNEPLIGTTEDSEIFFVVKKGDFYYVKFGKNLQSEDINSIGKSIVSTDTVLVSYVVASGTVGNNVTFSSVSEFTSNGALTVPSVTISSPVSNGGFDSPDLNYLKYLGPRYYGYLSLVTQSDYEAAIAASGYVPNETNIQDQIAVFDGQDYNSVYGKVYYSIIDLGASSTEVQSLTTKLAAKSVVGLSIEYLESDDFTGNLSLAVTYNPNKTTISKGTLQYELQKDIEDLYAIKKFNNNLSKSDLISLVVNKNPALTVSENNITMSFVKTVDYGVSRNIRFYHAISSFTTSLVSTDLSASRVKFETTSTSVPELSGYRYIGAYLSNGTAVNLKVGVFNPTTGHILFYDNINPTTTFTLTITANTNSITPQNNMAVEYAVTSLTVT
jgi:hypothetical protein